jgi:hypothetical protein
VAIVKARYPFSRAYALAEDLCQSAKREVRKSGEEGSALDDEIHMGGPVLPLAQRRVRNVVRAQGQTSRLHARPYVVVGVPSAPLYRRWGWFRGKLVHALQQDEAWTSFHSQLEGLAPALRQGPDATRRHLDRWRDRFGRVLPSPEGENLTVDGFMNGETPFLDAIERMGLVTHCPGGIRE